MSIENGIYRARIQEQSFGRRAWTGHEIVDVPLPVHNEAASFGSRSKGRFAHAEAILSRENQMQCFAIRAHPFCREAAGLTGTGIPLIGVEDGRPWAPGLRRIVDGKAAAEARVAAGQSLTPEVPLEAGVVRDA